MKKTTGTIIDIKGDNIKVEVDKETCSSCGNHNDCSLSEMTSRTVVEVPFTEGAQVNDRVELDIEESKILFLSVLFYLIPSVLILGFSLTGYFVFKSELAAALLGLAGIITAFAIIFAVDKLKKNSFKHKIKRLLK